LHLLTRPCSPELLTLVKRSGSVPINLLTSLSQKPLKIGILS